MREIYDFLLNGPADEVIGAVVLALILGAMLVGMILDELRD